ncbi:MAG: glycosyltransferase family 4 protein [Saprospiraceae bacterium]|nr:glycosyltransferase family 4 protein [Saprospiraceae bacterium]
MTKKRIAISANTSWNIYNFRIPLIHFLQKNGYEVIAVAPEGEATALIEQKGIPVHILRFLERKGTNPVNEIKLINEYVQAYKKQSIDLALNFTIKPNIYGAIAANRIGIPSTATVTGLGHTFISKGISSTVAKQLYKMAFRKANRVIFQNEDDRSLFESMKLASAEKTLIIPGSGIDTNHFSSVAYPDFEKEFNFLFVGRLLFDKGMRELDAAFQQIAGKHPQAHLHIVGSIDNNNPAAYSQEALEQLTQQPNVHFHGRVDDPRPFLANCHCVVLPSYREGLPRVIHEAMATARPAIVTDVPGCRQTVKHGYNGFQVAVKDAAALAAAMHQIIEIPHQERIQMGQNGRKMAEDTFEAQIVNQKYLEVCRQLLS